MRLIQGVRLIDGTGISPQSDAAVLVNDQGRIEAVGPRESIDSPPGAEVISATGMTLLPGLIDCHDHLSSFTYDLMSRWRLTEPESLRNLRIAKVAEETMLALRWRLKKASTPAHGCWWLPCPCHRPMAIQTGPVALATANPHSWIPCCHEELRMGRMK